MVAFMVAMVACICACSAGTGMNVPIVCPTHVISESAAAMRSSKERLNGLSFPGNEGDNATTHSGKEGRTVVLASARQRLFLKERERVSVGILELDGPAPRRLADR